TVDVSVERRVAGEDRAYVAGQSMGDFLRGESYAGSSVRERQIHLIGVLNRLEHLLFERCDTAVPKERAAIAAVDEGRSITSPLTAQHADRDRTAVGESSFGVV